MTTAIFKTAKGDIRVTLFDKTAPIAVANFIKLAKDKFYDGLAFHRVIANFMIQGGCPNTKEGGKGHHGTGGPGYNIKCETGPSNPEKHTPGTLSMAHAGKDTGGSQFFITHKSTPHLDGVHTVFGRIVDKTDQAVVDTIAAGDRFTVVIKD